MLKQQQQQQQKKNIKKGVMVTPLKEFWQLGKYNPKAIYFGLCFCLI